MVNLVLKKNTSKMNENSRDTEYTTINKCGSVLSGMTDTIILGLFPKRLRSGFLVFLNFMVSNFCNAQNYDST